MGDFRGLFSLMRTCLLLCLWAARPAVTNGGYARINGRVCPCLVCAGGLLSGIITGNLPGPCKPAAFCCLAWFGVGRHWRAQRPGSW